MEIKRDYKVTCVVFIQASMLKCAERFRKNGSCRRLMAKADPLTRVTVGAFYTIPVNMVGAQGQA